MKNALELRGIVKRYGSRTALDGLDLTIPNGSILGLVGSNGAGKTTSMGVSVGLLRTDAGSVNLFGEGAFNPRKHSGRVSLLPQDCRMPSYSHLDEMLRFYGKLQGIPASELSRNVDEAIDLAHLEDRRHNTIKSLSHGMMCRLSIAQAFLGNPELVLLDEPMNGLDPREVAHVREMIRTRRGKQAIVISSHVLSELEALCDQVAFVENGRLVRQGSLAEVTQQSSRITLRLIPGELPEDALTAALPGVQWRKLENGNRVEFTLPANCEPAEANARLLPVLIDAGIGILEIQCGSQLESIYLGANDAKA